LCSTRHSLCFAHHTGTSCGSTPERGPLHDARTTLKLVLVESPEELVQRWPHLREAQERSGDAAAAAVPLLTDQEVLGVLYAAFRAPRRFHDHDTAFLEALGRQCGQALDRARLFVSEQQTRAAAEEAVAMRDRFLSVASHELKTPPLISLLLQAQLLERRVERASLLPEREQRALQLISRQSRRLDRMIVALLDISRLELGQLSLNRESVDLCALARRTVAEVQPTTEIHAVTYTAPEDALFVDGDELRLEQVLQNLLQNAIKYSPEGGPIEVIVEARAGQVCVVVSDRGIGIPEEALPRLFERFYRAPNAEPRHISGLGIGLYVVKEIVRLHGGSVGAGRQQGGGSRFFVCLPQASASQAVLGPDALAIEA
jgi:signal transduction histidine kinase